MFDLLHSSANQEVFEKHLCIKSSHYEKYGRFLVTQRNPSRTTTKLTLFTVSKDEGDTKEDTGKSIKNDCTSCSVPKGTSRDEAISNIEKIKPVALAVIELCLSEGINQSVSQSLKNSVEQIIFKIL